MVTASFKGIPFPPSTNAIWQRTRTGIAKSSAYAKWRTDAGWLLKAARQPRIPGPYSLSVRAQDGASGADLDNLMKALGDALQDAGVIENDKLCRKLTMEWAPDAWLVEMDVEAVG